MIELNDSTEYMNESKLLEKIKELLSNPALKNAEQTKYRLLLWLKTQVKSHV